VQPFGGVVVIMVELLICGILTADADDDVRTLLVTRLTYFVATWPVPPRSAPTDPPPQTSEPCTVQFKIVRQNDQAYRQLSAKVCDSLAVSAPFKAQTHCDQRKFNYSSVETLRG
jgi:hypothetical protein